MDFKRSCKDGVLTYAVLTYKTKLPNQNLNPFYPKYSQFAQFFLLDSISNTKNNKYYIMTYTRKVTKKGQVTIPKEIRDEFEIDESQKVVIYTDPQEDHMIIKPVKRFSDLGDEIEVSKENRVDPVKAREIMDENYERQ